MEIRGDTLDDVLLVLYPHLLASQDSVPTSRGDTLELRGVMLEIIKPRARLSRTETRGKPFSCLGELLWYLSRDNSLDFVRYYIPRYKDESEDGETVYGGYGSRLFSWHDNDQIRNIITLLSKKPTSRRAVVQLFDSDDIATSHAEIPCTTTMQFLIRDNLLSMIVTMRSNDAFMGLPHDVFCFTLIQEIMARSLNVELGTYTHFVGSMHVYECDKEGMSRYLSEGVQPTIEMDPMPLGDPWAAITNLLVAEDNIRCQRDFDDSSWPDGLYWRDFVILLKVFAASGDSEKIEGLKNELSFERFSVYLEPRKEFKRREQFKPRQPRLEL